MKLEDITKFTLPTWTNITKDVGQSAQDRLLERNEKAVKQQTDEYAREMLMRAKNEKDPEKKARLLLASRQFSQMNTANPNVEKNYSSDINEPYWKRAAKAGLEGGANFAVASTILNPIGSALGINPNLSLPSAPVTPTTTAPTAPTTGSTGGLPTTPPSTPTPPFGSPEGPMRPPSQIPMTNPNLTTPQVPAVPPAPPVSPAPGTVTPTGTQLPPGYKMKSALDTAGGLIKGGLLLEGLKGVAGQAMNLTGLDPAGVATLLWYGGKSGNKPANAQEGPEKNPINVIVDPQVEQEMRSKRLSSDAPEVSTNINDIKKINGKWLVPQIEQFTDDRGDPLILTNRSATNLNTELANQNAPLESQVWIPPKDRATITINQNQMKKNEEYGRAGETIKDKGEELNTLNNQMQAIQQQSKVALPNILNAIRNQDLAKLRKANDPSFTKLMTLIEPLMGYPDLINDSQLQTLVNSASVDSFNASLDGLMRNAIVKYNEGIKKYLKETQRIETESNPMVDIQTRTGAPYTTASQAWINASPQEGGSVQGTPHMMPIGGGSGLPAKPQKLDHKGLPKVPRRFEYR